jgi:hypothetical protein
LIGPALLDSLRAAQRASLDSRVRILPPQPASPVSTAQNANSARTRASLCALSPRAVFRCLVFDGARAWLESDKTNLRWCEEACGSQTPHDGQGPPFAHRKIPDLDNCLSRAPGTRRGSQRSVFEIVVEAVMTSPERTPAFAAGLPACGSVTSAPSVPFIPRLSAMSSRVRKGSRGVPSLLAHNVLDS